MTFHNARPRLQALLAIIAASPTPLSSKQIAAHYGGTVDTVLTQVRVLLRQGLVARTPLGRGCVWTTAERAQELPKSRRQDAKQRQEKQRQWAERVAAAWSDRPPVQRTVASRDWAGKVRVTGPRSVFEVRP
jgi:hypothetical protein